MYILKNKKYLFCVRLIDRFGHIIKPILGIRQHPLLPDEVKKIVVVRLDHIGDLIMSTPFLTELKRCFPHAKIDLVTSVWGTDVFSDNPDITNLILLKGSWFQRGENRYFSFGEIIRLISTLKAQRYDLGIDLRGDFRSIVLLYLAKVRYTIGYGVTGGSFLLSKTVLYEKGLHEVKKNLNVLSHLGHTVNTDRSPRLLVTKEEGAVIEEKLKGLKIFKNDFLIGVHPGAGYPSKIWSDKKMITLINLLEALPIQKKIVFTGTNDDKEIIKRITAGLNFSPYNMAGTTTFKQLCALMKRLNLFIGYDSGPAHAAGAAGTPGVILFSGTNTSRQWKPIGNFSILQKEVTCSPCELKDCPIPGHPCMNQIEVEDVLFEIKKLIPGLLPRDNQ